MTRKSIAALACSTALALVSAGPSRADVTADQVWQSWKDYVESLGATVAAGSQSNSNGTLVLNDLNLSMELPDGTFSGTLAMLQLRELGDGTVEITMSPDYPMSVSTQPENGEQTDIGLLFRQGGLVAVASGSPEALTYDYSADSMGIELESLRVDGQDLDPKLAFGLAEIAGTYLLETGDTRHIASDATAGRMDIDIDFVDPETSDHVMVTGQATQIATTSNAVLPNAVDMADPHWVFGDEFDAKGTMTMGASSYSATTSGEGQEMVVKGDATSSELAFALLDGSVSYGGTAKGLAYRFSGTEVPFPEVGLDIEETSFNLTMPLQESEDPRDFGLVTRIVGLSVGDEIWSMIDPGQVLPRDPATAIFDLSGKARWLIDLSDPAQLEQADDAPPAEVHELNINEIALQLAGASIQGGGGFTFDQNDLQTFGGMPAPTGEVNLTIVGANGLIDKLIQMGLLPEDQAMGARMMLGMFATPGEGQDTLVSKIEVRGDGSVLANGNRLK